MKKILITYATYGSGHKSIAQYIANYLNDSSDYEIELLDIMDYTGFMCNLSLKAFNFVYKHRLEHLFSFFYNIANTRINTKIYKLANKKLIYNEKIKNKFISFNPDLVISSHFYGSDIVHRLNKQNLLNSKIMTIMTDYSYHKFWIANKDPNEIFIVANEIVKKEMIKNKCASKKIYTYGLPFDILKYNDVLSKEQIAIKYNIKNNKKVILFFMGGSSGSKGYFKYYKKLINMDINNIEVVVVCGKNKEVYEKAVDLKNKLKKKNIHVLGYINNVYELLKISDIVITKPGGATVTECIETKNVMLLLPGIGGQEKYNARFVCGKGYGLRVRYLFSFKNKLQMLVTEEDEFNKYKDSYKNVNSNNSLEKMSKLIKKIL